MKSAFLFALVLSFVAVVSFAQPPKPGHYDAAAATRALKEQASTMGRAFLHKDYTTFCKYSYPKLLTMMGGEAKMIQAVTQAMDQMKAQGIEVSSFSLGEPVPPVKSGTEWQSMIPQHTTLKTTQGSISSTSTLLAFSSDNGHHWTFLDTSNKDMATIRQVVPNLSPSIKVPPPQAPLRSGN